MLNNKTNSSGGSHKTRNRIIGVGAIVAVIILILLLRSCGTDNTPDDPTNPTPTPGVTDQTPTPGPSDNPDDETTYHMFLRGDKRIELTVGDTFVDEGVEVRDQNDKLCPEMELEVITEGEVNTAEPGTYIITYKLGDEVLRRFVYVHEKEDDGNNQPGETDPGTTTTPPPSGNPDDNNGGNTDPGHKDRYDMSGVSFNNDAVTYDGNTHSIYISGTLPTGVRVTYEGNARVNAGTYVVTAHFYGDDNHEPIPDMKASLTIRKAYYDMSDVVFDDCTVKYDGNPHSIYLDGTLPAGVTVRYTGNGKTNPGTYTVTAHFSGDSRNYHSIDPMKATLTIWKDGGKPSYDMTGVSFNDATFIYDGEAHSIFISGNLPAGVTVSYTGNGRINSGEYFVTAHFTGSAEYNPIPDMTAKMTISKANYDMSHVSFNDSSVNYDGKAHSIYISGNLPEGVTVRYEGNGKTQPGTYTVTAIFTGDSNHNPISNMTATLTIHSTSIDKPSYDMSGVTFEDMTVTYDGDSHSIFVSGKLPDGVTVTYEGNGKTNAGEYLVTAHFRGSADYNPIPDMTAKLTIKKASYDMSNVSFNNSTVNFDGKPHSIFISGTLPEGITVRYEGNNKTQPGTYTVTAIFTGDSNHNLIPNMTATLTIHSQSIEKPSYDMSGVTFEDVTVTYDGNSHSIFVSGKLPDGVSVTYENNGKTNAGEYLVTAHFKGSADYNPIPDMTAKLTISKATYDMSGVKFNNSSVNYDGKPHSIYISGKLPDGVSVRYEGNDKVQPGTYTVTAIFTGDSNHNTISNMTATLTIHSTSIEKPSYDMSGVTFEDKTETYDGNSHSIFVSGKLPDGVSVSYENNGKTNAGDYLVTAHFTGSADYNPIPDMTATLTISKATYNMSGVTFEDKTFTYDGKPHSIFVSGKLPDGVGVRYEGNGKTEVGGPYPVTAIFTGDNNHNPIPNMTAKITIEDLPAYDMTGVSFDDKHFTYDGQTHSLAITGTLPDGVSVSYEGNGQTEYGEYKVTAHFTGDDEHKPIADMTATLYIDKATYNMSGVTFEDETFTYDGKPHSIFVSGKLPDGVSVRYEGNGKTETGTYTVTAIFTGDNNHNPIPNMTAEMTIDTLPPYDMTGVSFNDAHFTYDGDSHSISVTGDLPSGVTVSYEGNGQTEHGEYTVTAHFTGDDKHKPIADMTATLYIDKATFDASSVSFGPFTTEWDDTTQTVTFSGSLPKYVTVDHYEDNEHSEISTYHPTVYFSVDTNNVDVPSGTSKSTTWEITKATIDLTGLNFPDKKTEIEYDGNEHSYDEVTGTLPDGVLGISHSIDKSPIKYVGTYTVTAHFTVDEDHYYPVSDYVYTIEVWTDDPNYSGDDKKPGEGDDNPGGNDDDDTKPGENGGELGDNEDDDIPGGNGDDDTKPGGNGGEAGGGDDDNPGGNTGDNDNPGEGGGEAGGGEDDDTPGVVIDDTTNPGGNTGGEAGGEEVADDETGEDDDTPGGYVSDASLPPATNGGGEAGSVDADVPGYVEDFDPNQEGGGEAGEEAADNDDEEEHSETEEGTGSEEENSEEGEEE